MGAMILPAIPTAGMMAGCGGSSGEQTYSVRADTNVTTGDVSRAQFVVQANGICQRGWVAVVKNFLDYSRWNHREEGVPKQYAKAVRLSMLAGIDFEIFDAIYRSKAPQGEGDDVEHVIGALQSAVEQGEKGLIPVSSPAQVLELFAEYNRLARAYGLDDCLITRSRLREVQA